MLSRKQPEFSLQPPLTVGIWTGCSGLLIGGIWGTFRSKTPTSFAVASGLQAFGLGTAFWFFRNGILSSQTFGRELEEPRTRLKASTAAGAVTGGLLGLVVRSPRGAIQATFILSALGWSGQVVYNFLDRRHTAHLVAATGSNDDSRIKGSLWWKLVNSVADMKYSPLSKMGNEDFENMLQEKLVEIEADVALLDERIERLRREDASKTRRGDEQR